MPRGRPSSTTTTTTTTPLKRPLSPPAESNLTLSSRHSKRLKSSPISASSSPATRRTTPKKSQFFKHDSTHESEPESEIEAEASGYEDEDASVSEVSSPPGSESEEEEDEYVSSEEDQKKSRKRTKVALKKTGTANGIVKTAKAIVEKGKELWRPGVKADLAPGEEVFIRLPKARGDGGVKYKEGVLHPNTMLFLGDLAENNEREWLKMHDADYRQSKKDFDFLVEKMTEKLVEIDETIPELPPKDLTHFSAAWSRTGRKGPYAAYYLQIKPSGSFLGGGLWCPEAAPLALMRRAIDRKSEKLKSVLLESGLRTEFLGGTSKDEKKAVKAFIDQNQENALKTKPKGYDADNPNIPLLRLRNYTLGRKLKDEEVVGPKAPERIAGLMTALMPFITYLNSIVMPDDPASESGNDSDDEEDEDNE
ncbi:MAG: hypothetical protein Q9220_000075 [cf. Caloplaca sp. 1 TL-2023]